jgi:DMSO/TMAO reductase YedYZ molybdopterin-dependent catalytic subunit
VTRREAAATAAGVPSRVTLVGDGERVVDPVARRAPRETVTASLRCASGERWSGEWRGVPVDWLLDRTPGGTTATHVRVGSADDHVACVPVVDALGGVLATERCDEGALPPASRPRFVAPAVDGVRAVKSVRRLELVELAPGEDAEDHESLTTLD